jgi:riboflavin synthase
LSLYCLAEVCGVNASVSKTNALRDEDINVRSTAAASVLKCYSEASQGVLLKEVSTNEDVNVRSKAALAVGNIGDVSVIERLRAYFDDENDPTVKHSIHIALAKLGSREDQEQVFDKLVSEIVTERYDGLKELEYIRAREHVTRVAALLEDESDIINVAPEPGVLMARICDVAVMVSAEILDHPFTFSTDRLRVFTESEIDEVQREMYKRPAE